jgi:cysteine desulfurase
MNHRLAGNLNISVPGVDSDALVIALLDIVAVSTGSACTSEKVEPSHVLKALGKTDNDVSSAIRFGLGSTNTQKEVLEVTSILVNNVSRLRSLNFDY